MTTEPLTEAQKMQVNLFNHRDLKKFLGKKPLSYFKELGLVYKQHSLGFTLNDLGLVYKQHALGFTLRLESEESEKENFDFPFHSDAIGEVITALRQRRIRKLKHLLLLADKELK
jgi:hypothetical protein